MKLPQSLRASTLDPTTAGSSPQAPASKRRHRARRRWIAYALAAALIVAAIAATYVSGGLAGALRKAPTPSSPAQAPAPADPLATEDFGCARGVGFGTSGAPAIAYIDAVLVQEHGGYERLIIQFANGRPHDANVAIADAASPAAGLSPRPTPLKGGYRALVTVHGSDAQTRYHGPTDIATKLSTVLELRKVEDSAGTVQWAVGLSAAPCFRAGLYDQPARLIVDFQVPGKT